MADEIIDTNATTGTTNTSIRGTSLLEQLGISAADVLQAPNVEGTLTAPQAPVTDALGIFRQQEETFGVPTLTTAYQEAQARRIAGEQLAKQEQLTIEGRRKKLGVLRGEQSQAAKQAALDISTLLQGEQLAQSALTTAQARAQQAGQILYNEYQTKVNLQLQYPGLDINPLTDTFETVSNKLEEYQEEQKKKAYKEALKEKLRALGKSTKGLSKRELERKLEKANKAALAEAKEERDLKLEGLRLDIENTKSIIANRGKDDSVDEAAIASWASVVESDPDRLSSVPEKYKSSVVQIVDPNIFKEDAGIEFNDEEDSGFFSGIKNWLGF